MLIQEKIKMLKEYTKEEVWYIVKQEMEFWKVCYAVSILEEFQNSKHANENLEKFFKRRSNEIQDKKMFDSFITTHRMLLNGYVYGLINKKGRTYDQAELTEVYKKIKLLCNGDFEKIDSYYFLIEQQIEKIYFSSILDEKYRDIRLKYRLYPLFLLYRVLIEIGKKTGRYEITREEFIVFLCTTEKYEDYKDTVRYILESRNSDTISDEVKLIAQKLRLDIRYNIVLKNINTISQTMNGFKISNRCITLVEEKLTNFEKNKDMYKDISYIKFLCSNKSLTKY